MDNVVIPNAPAAVSPVETISYTAPRPPVYGEYTRITFDSKTGEMVKDKYIRSKDTAFKLHLAGLIASFLCLPMLFGLGDFYCRRIGWGLLKTFTAGGLYILAIRDIIKTHKGEYDTKGKCILL